jgi:chorismate synthase
MGGSTFGRIVTLTTFGESHGKAVGVILEGIQSGFPIDQAQIQHELDRRKPGQSSVTTSRKESDTVDILSGVFEGKTLGTPIMMMVPNADQHSSDYQNIKESYRPGHADYTYDLKYGLRDYRGGGRSSGRETTGRTAAGAIAKQLLARVGIKITAYTLEAGGITSRTIDFDQIEKNIMRCPDASAARKMVERVEACAEAGESIGGIVECRVEHMVPGLGEPVFDKLDALLARAILSIGAVKGFEIGEGFKAAGMTGSEHNDQYIDGQWTNHAGGINGGISSGEDIIFRCAVKPTPSIAQLQKTLNSSGEAADITIEGRHDPCICPRIIPVVEAMTALTLLDAYYLQYGKVPV